LLEASNLKHSELHKQKSMRFYMNEKIAAGERQNRRQSIFPPGESYAAMWIAREPMLCPMKQNVTVLFLMPKPQENT
jgi:hypothetical protein